MGPEPPESRQARCRSRDLDVSHLDRKRATGHVARQEREGGGGAFGLHAPPERVAAGEAGRRCVPVAERTVEAGPGRKGRGAVVRFMAVMKEKEGHAASLLGRRLGIIGDGP
jgi:hypothetical protein